MPARGRGAAPKPWAVGSVQLEKSLRGAGWPGQRQDNALGVEAGGRVFIGTVHSFSLTQIVMPYTKSAWLGLPDNFSVATQQEQRVALERAYRRTIGGPGNPQDSRFGMGRYRRSILNRNTERWRTLDPDLARLVEAYEEELRRVGVSTLTTCLCWQ